MLEKFGVEELRFEQAELVHLGASFWAEVVVFKLQVSWFFIKSC